MTRLAVLTAEGLLVFLIGGATSATACIIALGALLAAAPASSQR